MTPDLPTSKSNDVLTKTLADHLHKKRGESVAKLSLNYVGSQSTFSLELAWTNIYEISSSQELEQGSYSEKAPD